MSVAEALKGARIELAALKTPKERVLRLGAISKIFVSELLGSLALVPYGVLRQGRWFCSFPLHSCY